MAQEPNQVNPDSASDTQPTATTASPTATAAEIRSQIEHTRAEMSDTIDAIQARLSPSRIVTNARQSVVDATVGRVKQLAARTNSEAGDGYLGSIDYKRGVDAVKENPIPFALIGAAATALMARGAMRSANAGRRHSRGTLPVPEPRVRQSRRFGGNAQRMLLGVCAAAAAWSAWQATRHTR